MSLSAWIRASRPLAHGNIAPPILLGQALAFAHTGRFAWEHAALAFGFGIVDHLFIVFSNDVADVEADRLNAHPSWFSGGSRVLVEGQISVRALALASIAMGVLLLAGSGAAAWALDRPSLLGLAAAAVILALAYGFPPARLAYRGYGELAQALGTGLVLPLVGYVAQAGELGSAPFEALIPFVIFGFASNILTALPDTEGDRAGGKRSWPVRRTEARARRDAVMLIGIGLVGVTQLGPAIDPRLAGLAVAPSALALLLALRVSGKADSTVDRAACERFSALGLAAITFATLTISGAWFLEGR
ncbi:MAG: prenyltransferase [Sandaracinaceae bacterium]